MSKNCIDFLHKALMIDHNKRWSARQLLNHDWIMEHYQTYQNKMEIHEMTLQDDIDILNRMYRFENASSFNQMLTSLAIGLGLDSRLIEEKTKIERLYFNFNLNRNCTITFQDF